MKLFGAEAAADVVKSLDSGLGTRLLEHLQRFQGSSMIEDIASVMRTQQPDLQGTALTRAAQEAWWKSPEGTQLHSNLSAYADNMFKQAPNLVTREERGTVEMM